jgi:tetratricopeptide (TPR) repeat protein
MANRTPAARKRWQVTLIVTLFTLAVAGAAFTGWRFARESPPHQGPIVLISVDGLRADRLAAYGARPGTTPAIDALAADGIVFERAYTHSPQTLPSHAALLSGQLPFDNGVRDEGGYALKDQARTIAELLRNRGFNTGAAVSSFLLRRATGIAQGFSFYDAEIPDLPLEEGGLPEREGLATFDVADQWLKTQTSQRYFLFLEVNAGSADAVVGRIVDELKRTKRYNDSTIFLTADHGDAGSAASLNDASLRVPLIVKQPGETGGGRHVLQPVQHIDVLPTLLDLVRAPMPSGLRGRSLRAILDKTSGFVPDQPIYAELLAPQFRFDGLPAFSLSTGAYRIVRGNDDQLQRLVADAPEADPARVEALKASLDRLMQGRAIEPPTPPAQADEDRLAAFGYLQGLRQVAPLAPIAPIAPVAPVAPLAPLAPLAPTMNAEAQAELVASHRAAVAMIAQKRYSAALDRLRAIASKHPDLASVQYQVGVLLARTGRLDEAAKTFAAITALRPDDPQLPIALASTMLRARRVDDATRHADRAVELADAGSDPRLKAGAHEIAARVALAREDRDAANAQALAAQKADPQLPLPQFVRGRLLYDDAKYEEALAAFQEAQVALKPGNGALAELHFYLGNSFARLDRYADAEAEFQEELREFPQNIGTYASLAMLYRASNRDQAAEQIIGDLVEAAPTPEGYSMAARLLTIVGEKARAEALRSDARRRFRGDPSLALLGRGR